MGYFLRLDSSRQLDEAPPSTVSREIKANPAPVQPAAEKAAAPAASPISPDSKPAAVHTDTPAAVPASTPEKASTPVVKLDAPSPADDTAARKAHEEDERRIQ